MHKLTFHPLGNADCCRIDLDNGKKILIDYADMRDPKDKGDLRCDLAKLLRDDLDEAGRNDYDVVAFTHLDEDHIKGSSEFFWLQHAEKYQNDKRVKIKTLWVPAAAITEEGLAGTEAFTIRAEARHRFKSGKDIRVFSRPEKLRQWCVDNSTDFESRKHLMTDAGCLIPDFTISADGVEFFVHSPFAHRLNATEVEDRNSDALVTHATFTVNGISTRVWFMADTTHTDLADIIDITNAKKRTERLDWDIIKLPHHCSYLSLGPDKGEDKTEPLAQIKKLLEKHGQAACLIVSTSEPIPEKGTDADKDAYPPHRESANYYKEDVLGNDANRFKVTMEHPTKTRPEPLVIEIDDSKATVVKRVGLAGAGAFSVTAPRAGIS
jgi:hypothetical protein